MNKNHRPLAAAAGAAAFVALLTSGCADVSPNWDSTFGDASRQLRAQQLIDPNAPTRNRGVVPAGDAHSTQAATDQYIDSFKSPPPTNVINIGVGAGGNGR